MRPSVDTVRDALSRVHDPELRRSLTELDMVRSVEAAEDGTVSVLIALTTPGCPLKQTIERDVTLEVSRVEGVHSVAVSFTQMTDAQRQTLTTRLRGGGPAKSLRIPSHTRVVAVASGKGGVGKSTLCVNLAVTLAREGHDVGLIDADIYGFSVPGMIGVEQRPVTVGDLIVPPVGHDVKTMSIGYFLEQDGAVMWRGPMLHKALEQFMSDVHWGEPDYLLIDMPPGTGDVAISLGQLLPRAEAVIVTTPNRAAQRVAERAAAVAHRMGMTIIGVVENMSWRICPCCGERDEVFGAGGGEALAAKIRAPLLGQVPLTDEIRAGSDDGRPVAIVDPDGVGALAYADLARAVARAGRSDPVGRMSKRLTVL